MDSTRRNRPLQIYQDPSAAYGDYQFDHSLSFDSALLQPLSDGAVARNISFDPPTENTSFSPLKNSPNHSSSHPHVSNESLFDSVKFYPPYEPIYYTDSPTKKAPLPSWKYPPLAQKPQKALFTTFSSTRAMDKENIYDSSLFSYSPMPKSDGMQGVGNLLKRGADKDYAASQDRNAKKQKTEDADETVEIPDPKDLPTPKDDGLKPQFSYAQIIGMAILRAPNRRLTLAQIYKWISDTFSFYREAEAGWMNSIRHNLSLNKAFIKQQRPKDDPGKGNYWTLKEGTEVQFLKDKAGRRTTNPENGTFFKALPGDTSRPSTAAAMSAFALPPKPSRHVDTAKFPIEQELSSDATLPASDHVHEDDDNNALRMPPPSSRITQSSPSPQIKSSPPVARHVPPGGTPPAVPRFPSVNRSGNRTRRTDSFRDSGFFSSIESSVTRAPHGGHFKTSELDHERSKIKRGRAEEEIARIRSSSYDHMSPTQQKPGGMPPLPEPSSPLNALDLGFPPLTPGLRFEPPRKAPPTVSPNTHLRNHRDAIRDFVGTPAHGLFFTPGIDSFSFSPAFAIHEDTNTCHNFLQTPNPNPGLVDLDTSTLDDNFWYRGSPVRRSARQQRPMLQRATTTAGVLADVTGLSNGNRLASPFRMPFPKNTGRQTSPSKAPRLLSPTPASKTSASRLVELSQDGGNDDENIFDGVDLGSDGASAEDDGTAVDIFKGFSKIGAAADVGGGKENLQQAGRCAGRPGLERAVSSRF